MNTTTRFRSSAAAPLFRWVGGKRQILKHLRSHLPPNIGKLRYHEAFLGAGTLFFDLGPSKAVLNDANAHLISCYRAIRSSPEAVFAALRTIASKHSEEHYYKVRETYNQSGESFVQAARFIYLNRTCFNGIFRVNTVGAFNVPYGKANPAYPTLPELQNAARLLRNRKLLNTDFAESVSTAESGDFVYLDPPYPPLNGTSYFAHYTMDRFAEGEQARVAQTARALSDRGVLVMVSNADTPSVRRLYEGFHMYHVDVIRFVTCKEEKHRVKEVIITNYALEPEASKRGARRALG